MRWCRMVVTQDLTDQAWGERRRDQGFTLRDRPWRKAGRHLAPGAVLLWSTGFSPSPEASFLSSAQKSATASCLSPWLTGEKAAGVITY